MLRLVLAKVTNFGPKTRKQSAKISCFCQDADNQFKNKYLQS